MNAIMGLIKVDPDYADGIDGTRLQHGFPVTAGSIPEQVRIIMIGQQESDRLDRLDGSLADRERIMVASGGRWKLRDDT
jgi:hypothetical protein